MFWKNRAIQLQMVKNPKRAEAPKDAQQTLINVDVEKIADNAIRVIAAVGVIYAANKVLSTACDVARIAAQGKFLQ